MDRLSLARADGSPVRVLVVDDEAALTDLLAMAMRYEGWEIRTVGSGAAALRLAKQFQPDAVVLDVMLPDFDGFEIMRRLRADMPKVPILFLTARDAVEDRVAGLTAGGDGYVTKPFSLEELVARLRALMRRAGVGLLKDAALIVVGDLTLDEDSHEVWRGDDQISLTATEFELLRFMMRTRDGYSARRRYSTGCGTTTSVARQTSSSFISRSFARRSMWVARQ